MSYITLLQTNFSQGEISPWLYGRNDITQYLNSARVMKNFIPRPQGGAIKRPGTKYIAGVKNHTATGTKLFSFIYGDQDTYVLEFGNNYIRFYRNQEQIVSGGNPYEVVSPYPTYAIPDLQMAQVYDSIFITHTDFPPKVLRRFSHTSWTFSNFLFKDGPYFGEADPSFGGKGSGISLTPSGISGNITITASAALFTSGDIGRHVRLRVDKTKPWGWAIITSFTSSTIVGATVQSLFDANTITQNWTMGSWSERTGYPRCVSFFEQRAVFAGGLSQPQTIWLSASGDISNFSPDNVEDLGAVDPDTAMDYTIYSSSRASVIYWIRPQRGLYLGTSEGVFLAKANNSYEALTPDNISITNIIAGAVSPMQPITVGNVTLYADEFKRRLQEIKYSFQEDAFDNPDTALLAEHCTKGLLNQVASAPYPNYLIWITDLNGNLFSLTYLPKQNITAWARHELGGGGVVESLLTVPGPNETEVWMIVKRTINGSVKRYVECFSPAFMDQDITDATFLDSYISYDGSPVTSFSGLGHLEGKTVGCFGDGANVVVTGTGAVSGGSIDLQTDVSKAIVGLPYESEIETNQLTSSSAPASLQGRLGRIQGVVLRLYRSYGGEIGISDSKMDIMPEYGVQTVMDGPLTLYSGDREFVIPSEYNLNPNMTIRHTLPVPFNLVSIVLKASVSAR